MVSIISLVATFIIKRLLIYYHVAPTCAFGKVCISAKIYPKCSVWIPFLPPVCMNVFSGMVKLDSLKRFLSWVCHEALKFSTEQPIPFLMAHSSVSSVSHNSPVKRQSSFKAFCARWLLSSVPNPNRFTQLLVCL